RAGAAVEQHADRVAVVVGGDDIELAVVVEVGDAAAGRVRAGRAEVQGAVVGLVGRLARARAAGGRAAAAVVVEEHGDRAAILVEHGEIVVAVAVEVGRHDRVRLVAREVALLLGERHGERRAHVGAGNAAAAEAIRGGLAAAAARALAAHRTAAID